MGANFLLVDDTKFMQTLTEKILQKMGHNVLHKASNGIEAIEFYEKNWQTIDVILLDVVMPKTDGLQALRKLRQINPEVKIIMVTSISSQSIVIGAMKAGATEFISKPFRLSEFAQAVNKVLTGK
ncbi:MAG: Chemotaxis protein CheY [Candidatus Heimdallarchaeota archaeon LC_2]|nr:MAG: Chemotaxis protein CheY [Candidatus Heimdallarchaeota archaeon LC_2]